MNNNRPHRLPILSKIPYKSRKITKYKLFTTKWEIHNFHTIEKIKHVKKLQAFSTLRFGKSMELTDLYKLMIGVNRLQTANINIPETKNLSRKKHRPIHKMFHHLKNLHVLMLSSRENQEITDLDIVRICEHMYKFRSIQMIAFDFFRCYSLSEAGMVSYIKRFKKIKQLRKLKFHFESCHDQTTKGTEAIATHLADLSHLEDILLSFCALSLFTSKIKEKSLTYLIDCLNKIKSLNKLVLGFRNCSMPSDKGLENVAKKLSGMHTISHLNLHLAGFIKIEDKGYRALGDNLAKMTGLEHLCLDIRNSSQLTDECLIYMFQGLVPLRRLELLSLNLNNCQRLTSKGVKGISDVIPKFQNLKYLQLQLIAFSVFEESIEQDSFLTLAKTFSQLPKLISLALSLGNSTSLDDSFIAAMLEDIQKIQNLTKFQLRFENVPKLTNQGLVTTAKKITPLPVNTINFAFENCYNFTDDGVEKFLAKLKENKKLMDIELDFVGCPSITQQMIEAAKSLSDYSL